jgi:outer membrane autotransporter protein
MRFLHPSRRGSPVIHSNRIGNSERKRNLLKASSILTAALLTAPGAFAQTVVSSSQELPAGTYPGIVVNNGAVVTGSNVNSTATGTTTDAIDASEASRVTLSGSVISTNGNDNAYGVSARSGAVVTLTGGSVTTLTTRGQTTTNEGLARGYALYANGAGSSVSADGTSIQTYGSRSYGAHALAGGAVALNNVSITTAGGFGYGVYASGAGSVLTGNNLSLTTTGFTGDAVWAYAGGRVTLTGGTYIVRGDSNPRPPGETANGLVAAGGSGGQNDGIVEASGITLDTYGPNSIGLIAGGDVAALRTSGTINLTGSRITVHGANGIAAQAVYGSTLKVTGSTLTSTSGTGIRIVDSAAVSLTGTNVIAGRESIVSQLDAAGSVQTIDIGTGSVLTANNGNLLLVNRGAAGGDGQVNFRLGAGSTSAGDILDDGVRTAAGYTDIFVSRQATWTGLVRGVRNFTTDAGGDVNFQGETAVEGDLAGNDTDYSFSPEGGTIAGDVVLANGSTTTGGSIAEPIVVGGNVDVDAASVFGGNWQVQGNVANRGTISPGNSIGVIDVAGNFTFGPASVYAVEVNAAGQSDLVRIGGIATLDGTVTVTPLDGVRLNAPYTILTAGSIVGTFDGVTLSSAAAFPFLAAALGYTPTSAYVTIVRSGVTYAGLGTTPNQVAVGGALDSLALTGALAQALGAGSVAAAIPAFDQLSGEVHASLRTGLFEDSRHVRNAALARALEPNDASGLSLWGNAYGSWGESGATGGFAKVDRMTKGVVAGIDTGLGGAGRIGLVGSYGRSDYDIDRRASSADVESYAAGIYAGSSLGGFSVAAGGTYSWHRIETDRGVAFAGFTDALSARYDGNTVQGFGDLGYAVPLGTGRVGPFVSAAYVRVHTDAVSERGGAAALRIAAQDSEVTFSTVGLRAQIGAPAGADGLRAHGVIGWRHAFGDRIPAIESGFAAGSRFVTLGMPISKESAVLDLGLEMNLASAVAIGASYSGQIGGDSSDNGVKAHFRVSF